MAKKRDSEWHERQVLAYQSEQPAYQQYAATLQSILKEACAIHSPLAIVQARPKSVASFAEKAVRKADKYDDPVRQLTDLCGGRVITSTSDQMKAICRFIRDQFCIDEANSLDAGSRLKNEEFGYLSLHYVVQLQSAAPSEPSPLPSTVRPRISSSCSRPAVWIAARKRQVFFEMKSPSHWIPAAT